MMDRWRGRVRVFLKFRKQNDRVKFLCIFALAGTTFLVSSVYRIGEIYRYVNTPAEYVLRGNGTISKECVDALLQNEGVTRVSRQRDALITIKYRGAGEAVNCTMLSRKYIEERFGKMPGAGTKKIYMNEAAFFQLQQEWSDNNGNIEELEEQEQGGGNMEFDVRYIMEEELSDQGEGGTAPAQNDKSAKLVVVRTGVQREEGEVFAAEDDGRLLREADSLRVEFGQHDLDGIHVGDLRKMGYSIENEADVAAEEYEVKIKLLHIQYGMLSGGICFLAVFVLYGVVRQETGRISWFHGDKS